MASMLAAFHPYPEDRLHLRMHRARSVILTSQELVEVRAAQRTFEGAYMRTALSQFSFALVVLKIFTSEFYPIGALFACYGAAVLLVAVYRRYEGNRQFFDSEQPVVEEVELEEDSTTTTDGGEGGEGLGGNGNGSGNGNGNGNGGGGTVRGRRTSRRSVTGAASTASVKRKFFRTSANSVGLLVLLSLMSYIALVVLLWQLVE
ncbi:hypothetical protein BT67DRAFT_450916 [Trichocladium antarcticum]|uniref:DUF202 domain-containing protein n=1 Tax=Trichocladium antarcticum TaxID=1450529 RepID=A0AAN6ZC75_9PEZI|nr:hypothetical protein BT67DRAFT_450916 [Trichocladium antarcticum]